VIPVLSFVLIAIAVQFGTQANQCHLILNKEYHPPNYMETDIATQISEILHQRSLSTQRFGVHRFSHAKAHGCVEAEFVVDFGANPVLYQGIFVPGKPYKAYMRFSNAAPVVTHSKKRRQHFTFFQ
jgi:hypothetical protein